MTAQEWVCPACAYPTFRAGEPCPFCSIPMVRRGQSRPSALRTVGDSPASEGPAERERPEGAR